MIEPFVSAIGGIPFIDAEFHPQPLLSVVAARRRSFVPHAHPTLEAYLYPQNARDIFLNHARSRVDEPESTAISDLESELLEDARRRILIVRPDWIDLLMIPVSYRRLLDDRVSMTSALIPQTLFLGKQAFSSSGILSEVLVHEFAHIWLNFLAETADLQTPHADETFTLPSGTRGKPVRGVLLAAHFAAAAHAFHLADGDRRERAGYLSEYLRRCLELIAHSQNLSRMGQYVFSRLENYQAGLSPTATEH